MFYKFNLRVLILSCCLFAAGAYRGAVHTRPGHEEVEKQMRLFSDVFSIISENYVDDVDEVELIQGAMKGMMRSLDSYSQFLDPEASELLKADTEGEFGGLGIRITAKDEIITVVTPLPDTPAYKLGISPGDRIVKINDESAIGLTLREAVTKLRGPEGTDVTISIDRDGEDEVLEFTITREIIVPQKVYTDMLDGNIGYLRLVEFTEDAPEIMRQELSGLKEEGIEGLILDIRNNPGGLLSSAIGITNVFIERGELVVYTQGRREDQNRRFYARRPPLAADVPLVVLINRGSASGSEIVAGAIKDHGRGLILGERTFGKASVQSIIDLDDGSSLRLTTARYYTPSGISIHKEGIEPDIKVELTREIRRQIIEQQQEILGLSEEEHRRRQEEIVEDPQLTRAHDILLARRFFLLNDKENVQ